MLSDELKAKGWTVLGDGWYIKGDWKVEMDTSTWLQVSTKHNPRAFDLRVLGVHESRWTANLIEHLCEMEDERHRLRAALETILDNPRAAIEIARSALNQCYHNWLVNVEIPEKQAGRVYCVVCGALRSS